MVAKKKVAIVVGRYYLTLPIIIGFYNLFDWDITILDLDMDPTHVARNEFFYKLLPEVKAYHIVSDKKVLRHFEKTKYDFVLATNINCKVVNWAKMNGLIDHLYIMFGAFLKPSLVLHTNTPPAKEANKQPQRKFTDSVRKIIRLRSYRSLYNKVVARFKNPKKITINYPDAYDLVFYWNKTEAHYYDGKRQVITDHPYHLYLAKQAKKSVFSGKILIAHNGDPVYYTPGFNEMIQAVIDTFSATCEITIKAHPLGSNFPKFNGQHKVIWNVLDETEAGKYDIFISEDSYMAVEMFFRGKYVINFGVIDQSASNLDFTHLWSNNAHEILSAIGSGIDNWQVINDKHINYLKNYFESYVPPVEFGHMALRVS